MNPTQISKLEKKDCKDYSDQDLIDLIKTGSTDKAARCLYGRYWKACKKQRKFRLSESEYISVFNDSLLALVTAIKKDTFEGRAKLKTFFCGILHNKCVDIRKKAETNQEKDESNLPMLQDLNEVSIKYDPGNDRKILKKALESLSLQHKRCWVLWDGRLAGFKWEELASKAGYTTKAARQTFSNTCKKLLYALIIEYALEELEPSCQEILQLKMKGHSLSEIAHKFQKQVSIIEIQYLSCKDQLKTILGQGGAWKSLKNLED